MILGLSIRRNAKNVDVCIKTSFYMRHKILDGIRTFMGIGALDCVVEMDEIFVPVSYKGNHKKSGFKMPRSAHKKGKQVKKRGISHEQVRITTALDRNGNIILEPICTGRISHSDLERLYKGRIEESSIICTDSHKYYIQFKEIIRTKNMLIQSVIPFVDTKIKGYKGRDAIFV